MGFFNKKEEVMKIELTQYGKAALRSGSFRPYYYAFYDDDIIYDISYCSDSESQELIQDRILTQARLKPAGSIYGSETKLSEINFLGKQKDGVQQLSPNNVDREVLLKYQIFDDLAFGPLAGTHPKLAAFLSPSVPGVKFQESVTRTQVNYNSTTNLNVPCDIEVQRHPHVGTYSGGSFVISIKEEFGFCDQNEFEATIYEVDSRTKQETNLYFNSARDNLRKVGEYFIVKFDESVGSQHVPVNAFEDCSSTNYNAVQNGVLPPPHSAWGVGNPQLRDVYTKVNEELHLPNCDTGDE